MKIHKISKFDSVYNIFRISEVDGVASERVIIDLRGNIIEIKADSPEQARRIALSRYSSLAEWENESAGRSIVARLNKDKMEELEKYRQTIDQLKKDKENRAQSIYD